MRRNKPLYFLSISIVFLIMCKAKILEPSVSAIVVESDEKWDLIWSDEFDKDGLPDESKWSYDIGDACDKPAGCGWGNQELQYYTEKRAKNARVEDGKLLIEVHKETYDSSEYTSARLISKGKGDWKYGRYVIRAKLAAGKGVWSAIWMLSTDDKHKGWPNSGEIDIMENVGFDPDSIIGTAHTLKYHSLIGTHKNGGIKIPGVQNEFHDYILEWEEDEYRVFVDENLIFTFENEKSGYEAWPFDERFHLILNVAYGGLWGGREGIEPESLPARMEVDYIRVYQ